MPELPEVEVVRRGLARWVVGRRIEDVEILHERPIRRHLLGAEDLRGNLIGTTVTDAVRRGKFLWLPLVDDGQLEDENARVHGDDDNAQTAPDATAPSAALPRFALMAHLGMSGQLLVEDSSAPDEKHLRVRFRLSAAKAETTSAEPGTLPTQQPRFRTAADADGAGSKASTESNGTTFEVFPGPDGATLPNELRFVDQRMFGGVFLAELVATADGQPGGLAETPLPLIPEEAAHIARDPLDPAFDVEAFHRKLRKRRTGLKRALLDQGLISGVGNIYADEALWAAKLHFARATDTIRRNETNRLVEACQQVMLQALDAGGTSFDSLYVNVNGASGYFERSLNAYGREGEPCRRCEALGLQTRIRRDVLMKRSSYTCPVCQPRPRNGRW